MRQTEHISSGEREQGFRATAGFVVILLAAVLALSAMPGCGGGEDGGGESSAQQEKQESGAESRGQEQAEGGQKEAEKEATGLTDAGKKLGKTVETYLSRLQKVAAKAGPAAPADVAAAWADLSAWCEEQGLPGAAARCAYQASRAGELDDATKQKLGLTETVEGVAVTPDQAEFLQHMRPQIRFIDLAGEAQLTLPDGSNHSTSFAEPTTFHVDAPFATVERSSEGGGGTSIPVKTLAGFRHVIRYKPVDTAPVVPVEALSSVYQGLQQWKQAGESRRDTLLQEGADTQGGTVQFETDADGNLREASSGRIRVTPGPEGGPSMQGGGQTVQVQGLLFLQKEDADSTSHVFAGVGGGPVKLQILGGGKHAEIGSGVYYEYEQHLSAPMANILGTIDKDLRRELAKDRVEQRRDEIEQKARVLEADGEFKGGWDADNWQRRQFLKARARIKHLARRQRRAGDLSVALDRAARLEGESRVEKLWANWPRFRKAMARMLEGSAGPLLERVSALTGGDSDGSGDGNGKLGYPVGVLAVLPTDGAIERIDAAWENMDSDSRAAAVTAIGLLDRKAAVEKLSTLSAQSTDDAVVTAAYRELAEFGGEGPAGYLEGPGVSDKEKAAMAAGRALLGTMEDLGTLPEEVSGAKDTAMKVATKADCPMAVPVIATLAGSSGGGGGGGGRGRGGGRRGMGRGGRGGGRGMRGGMGRGMRGGMMGRGQQEEPGSDAVDALVRLGDAPAAQKLLERLEAGEDLEAEMIETMTDPALTLLAGSALGEIRGGSADIALALGRWRPDGALKPLKEAASQEDGSSAVALALAAWGTPEALEAGGKHAGALSVSDLASLRTDWNLRAVDEVGFWKWRNGVDADAAAGFMDAAVRNSRGGKSGLAAALIARESGAAPSPDALLALARSTGQQQSQKQDQEEQSQQRSRRMGGRPGRGREQDEDDSGEGPWDLPDQPRVRAAEMYADAAGADAAQGLTELAKKGGEKAVRKRALHLLAERNMQGAAETLGAVAAGSEGEDMDADLRAAAAVALGKTGTADAGRTLMKLYSEQSSDGNKTLRAGACGGLAELSGRGGMSGGDHADLVEKLLQIAADGSGPDMRAAAVRAAAHGGAFEPAGNARVLRGLQKRYGWTADSDDSGGQGSGGSEGSAPVQVRLAVVEAASTLTGLDKHAKIVKRAASALQNEEDLADAWQDRAVDLARMGSARPLQFVGRNIDVLTLETLTRLPGLAKEMEQPPEPYYVLLAHAAAAGGGEDQQAMGRRYGSGRMSRRRERQMSYRMGRGRGQPEKTLDDVLPDPEPAEPNDRAMMQWACVEVLSNAPAGVLKPILQGNRTGLADNTQVGPAAVVHLAENVDGFDTAGYLRDYLTSNSGNAARRNGLAAARRAGPDVSSDLVTALAGGQLQQSRGRRGQGRRSMMRGGMEGRRYGAGGRGRGGGQEIDIKMQAARALGSMGLSSVLKRGFNRSQDGDNELMQAATTGMAHLPDADNPVDSLLSLRGNARSAAAVTAISNAVSEAGRVAGTRAKRE